MRGTWQTTGSSGSSGLVLAVIAAAVLIGSGAVSAIASALVTILIIVGVVIVLAVAGVVALLVYRTRSERPGRPIEAPAVYQLPPDPRPRLEDSHKPAIEPPREIHLHLHGLTPDQLAAIVTQRGAYPREDR